MALHSRALSSPRSDQPPPESGPVLAMQRLLHSVTTGGGRKAADALNEALDGLAPKAAGAHDVARVLLAALEDQTVTTATDSTGRSCRALLVGAVLRVGYPVALELSPEDLQHFREQTGPFRWASGRMGMVLAALVALSTGAGFLAWSAHSVPEVAPEVARPLVRTPGPLANAFFTEGNVDTQGFTEMVAARKMFSDDPRGSRAPLERCLSTNPENLECLRALGSVESYIGAHDHDRSAAIHARQIYTRYLELAPLGDEFAPQIRSLLDAQ